MTVYVNRDIYYILLYEYTRACKSSYIYALQVKIQILSCRHDEYILYSIQVHKSATVASGQTNFRSRAAIERLYTIANDYNRQNHSVIRKNTDRKLCVPPIHIKSTITSLQSPCAKVARRKSFRPSKHTHTHVRKRKYTYTDGYNYYDITEQAYTNNIILLLWIFLIFFSRRLITQCVSGANRGTACTLRGRLLFLRAQSHILPRIHTT